MAVRRLSSVVAARAGAGRLGGDTVCRAAAGAGSAALGHPLVRVHPAVGLGGLRERHIQVLGRRPRRKDPFNPIKQPRVSGYVPLTFAEQVIADIGALPALGNGVYRRGGRGEEGEGSEGGCVCVHVCACVFVCMCVCVCVCVCVCFCACMCVFV